MRRNLRRVLLVVLSIVVVMGMSAAVFADETGGETPTGKDPVAGVTIPFGIYEPTETKLYESKKVEILCNRVHVGHTITAEITFTSANYTEATIGDTKYESYIDDQAKTSTFLLPVELGQPLDFTAHTTSMGGKDIDYTVTVNLDKDNLKPVNRGTLQDGFYTTVINTNKAVFGWRYKNNKFQQGFAYPSKDYDFPVTVQIKDGVIADVAYTQDAYSIVANSDSDINYLMWAMDGHHVSDKCYQSKTVENGGEYHISVPPKKNGTGMKEQFVGKTDISGIDTVSAATLTSRAIIEAVDQNLTKAERGQMDDPQPQLPQPDTSADVIPEDGVYTAEADCIGATIDGNKPVTVTVQNGKITADFYIQQRQSSFPYLFSGTEAEALAAGEDGWLKPTDYEYGTKLGSAYTGAAFKSLDKPQLFQSYASSSQTWFNRPITIDSSTLVETEESKQAKVRDKQDNVSNNIVYSSIGMFRIQDEGTSVTKDEDGSLTVKIKIKPLASGKYDRMALTSYPEGTADEIKAKLDSLAISADKIEEIQGPNGQTGEITTLYSPEFTFKVEADQVGKMIPFVYSQDGKWKTKAYYMIVLSEKEAAARKTEIELNKAAEAAIAEVKADPANKEKVEAALAAIDKLTEEQKAALKDDIAAVNAAKTAIDNKEAAEAAIAAAKANPTNKAKVEAALAAISKLTDEQKAALADDIKAVNNAKTAIEKKEKANQQAAKDKAAATKVKATKIKLKKVKAGKKSFTVTWKKNANVDGYQVWYKTGSKAKTVKIAKKNATKKVVKKLKKGKKYTVKVRGYKKIGGKMVYTKWSSAKKVKIKK